MIAMIAIRMLVDADGSPNGHTIYHYEAGEIYRAGDTQPPLDDFLMASFVASGRAIEVDADGNPVATPASRRARKASSPSADAGMADATDSDATDAPAPAQSDVVDASASDASASGQE